MLKHEILDFMDVAQWAAFKRYIKTLPYDMPFFKLPDGRIADWYEDYDVNKFMEAHSIANGTFGEKEESNNAKSEPETVSVHTCDGDVNNENNCSGAGSEDSGTQQGVGNTEAVSSGGEVKDSGLPTP